MLNVTRLLLCIFASVQLPSFTLYHFSECDDFKDETKRNNLKNNYSKQEA